MRTQSFASTYLNPGTLPFWAIHIAAVAGIAVLGFSLSGLALALAFYVARMFFVTAGYHRYFSHRSYKTSRWFQFVLAVLSQLGMQRGVLWWAGHHRDHHRKSDTPDDVHSPLQRGFWWSHIGWFLSPKYDETQYQNVRDLEKFPELRFLNRIPHVPGIFLAVILLAVGGAHALVWGFFVATVLVWHGTFTINSLSHIVGKRRYSTSDDSRNNWLLGLLTLGEGWHNNHHHYQSSTNQGFFWWEIDITDYALRALAKVGLVWDLRRPPAHILRDEPRTLKASEDVVARPHQV